MPFIIKRIFGIKRIFFSGFSVGFCINEERRLSVTNYSSENNGYPANFIRDASTPPMQETADTSGRDEEQEREKEPLVVIPYVAGMSEDIRRVCRKFTWREIGGHFRFNNLDAT